jgi:AcrR family transcriptional regulator
VTPPVATRLPAAERRQKLIEAGLRVFLSGSYAGATTAEIARGAGVSEPILYRHFGSKRDLYFACLDEAWARMRVTFERKLSELGDPKTVQAMADTVRACRASKVLPQLLWIQALTEAGEDPEIRRYLRRHLRDVHDFVAGVVRRGQAVGAVPADRDANAEAWIFIGTGLLISVGERLGGLLGPPDFEAVSFQRRRWLTGSDAV